MTLLALCLISVSTFAKSSVYKVSKDGRTVYLGGTIHLLRASDYPLPAVYDETYAKCKKIVFEADITTTPDPEAILKLTSYQDERTLKTVLNDSVFEALSKACATNNLPMAHLLKMKPAMLLTMLSIAELDKAGIKTEGIDKFYATKAIADQKELLFLESAEMQLYLLSNLCEGNENAFTIYSLNELKKSVQLVTKLIADWRIGGSKLGEKESMEMKEKWPEIYQPMLVDRNNKWLPKIEQYFDDAATEFVLVGAMHLYGDDGLLNLLTQKGYKVKQME